MLNEVPEEEECILSKYMGLSGTQITAVGRGLGFCSNSLWRKKLWEVSVGGVGGDLSQTTMYRVVEPGLLAIVRGFSPKLSSQLPDLLVSCVKPGLAELAAGGSFPLKPGKVSVSPQRLQGHRSPAS